MIGNACRPKTSKSDQRFSKTVSNEFSLLTLACVWARAMLRGCGKCRIWFLKNVVSYKVCIDMTGCWTIHFGCPNLMASSRLCASQVSCLLRTEMFLGCGTFSTKTRTALGSPYIPGSFSQGSCYASWTFFDCPLKKNKTKIFSLFNCKSAVLSWFSSCFSNCS